MKPAIAALLLLAACAQPAPTRVASRAEAACRDTAIHAWYQTHERRHAAENTVNVLTLGMFGLLAAPLDDVIEPPVPHEVDLECAGL